MKKGRNAEKKFIETSKAGKNAEAAEELTGFVKDKRIQILNLTHTAQDNITRAAKVSSNRKKR